MSQKIKIGFFGTPELSAQVLKDILDSDNYSVEFVVTNPDKPFGRKQELIFSPVKQLAKKNSLKIFQPIKIRNNNEFLEEIATYHCDYFIVVAYGKILPKELLEIPHKMCINIHGSLLPAYRGASPIQSALLNGETETWVTIMQMSEWMDEGDMILKEKIAIAPDETTVTLFEKFWHISWKTLLKALEWLENNTLIIEKQDDSLATYCGKISKENGQVDWMQNAKTIYQKWQAYTPWPGIFAFYKGKRILLEKFFFEKNSEQNFSKIFKKDGKIGLSFEDGNIFLETVKPEGKKSQNISDFLNGNPDFLENGFDK